MTQPTLPLGLTMAASLWTSNDSFMISVTLPLLAASYRGLNYGPGLADFMQLNLTSYDRADEFSIQPFHSYVQM